MPRVRVELVEPWATAIGSVVNIIWAGCKQGHLLPTLNRPQRAPCHDYVMAGDGYGSECLKGERVDIITGRADIGSESLKGERVDIMTGRQTFFSDTS